MTSFVSLGVPARLSEVLADGGITTPTPIQAATLPDSLAGRDVLGRGRTGSGKTLAFLLPLVTRLGDGGRARAREPRALVLAPTRELATQIDTALRPLADRYGLTSKTVFGGVGQNPQVSALRRGVDIVVACPGRLEDLIEQGHCSLARVEITVLDEADHMSDLGFLPAVRRLLKCTPGGGQRMLFSATLDNAVDSLVRQFLARPVIHQADSAQSPVAQMAHHVLRIERDLRVPVLQDLTSAPGRTVVFTRTKHGAKALSRQLNSRGVPAVELHGNLSQNARARNLDAFHDGSVHTLVATDIAARGIHVDDVTLVVHADPPADHKAYLHRSGRTARAGAAGTVVTLMTGEQTGEVRALARAAGIKPTTTAVTAVTDPVLRTLAPGERVLVEPVAPAAGPAPKQGRARQGEPRRSRGQRGATQHGGTQRGGSERGRPNSGGPNSGASNSGRSTQSRQGAAKQPRQGAGANGASAGGSGRSRRPRRGGQGDASRSHSAASFSSGRR